MVIVDFLIIALIILFGYYGYKTGFVKTVVDTAGIVLVFVIAYLFKDPIAEWFSFNLPFFNFWGSFKGVSILNVVIYQLIAFIIIFTALMVVYALVVKLTSLVEKILKWTFILKLPSKVLGFIFGICEGIAVASVILMILTLPVFNFKFVQDSKVKDFLLEAVPITGTLSSGTNRAINEIMDLKDEYNNNEDKTEFNRKCLIALLRYKIITPEYAENLIKNGKLDIENSEEILDMFR